MQRQVHRERRDAVAGQRVAHRIRHELLAGSESVQEQRGRHRLVRTRHDENRRYALDSVNDLDVVAYSGRHVARRADHG